MLNEKRDNAVTRCRVQIHPDTPLPFSQISVQREKAKVNISQSRHVS